MLKVILAKIGISLFRYLPLEQIVAKLLNSVIQMLLASKHATKVVDQVRKTVTHLNELTALIEPMLDDQAVTGDEARGMFDQVNQTRLQIFRPGATAIPPRNSKPSFDRGIQNRHGRGAFKRSLFCVCLYRVCTWLVPTNRFPEPTRGKLEKLFF
jgi:hypothetical protein